MIDPVFALIVRFSLAALFLTACAHKLRAPRAFVAILAEYRMLPAALVRPVAVLVIAAEALTAAGLLAGRAQAAWAALGLIGAYTAAIGVNLLRGRRDIDCGCGGADGAQHIRPALILRNVLLAGAAVILVLPVAGRALHPLDWITIVAGVAGGALLYAAAGRLLAIGPRLVRLRG